MNSISYEAPMLEKRKHAAEVSTKVNEPVLIPFVLKTNYGQIRMTIKILLVTGFIYLAQFCEKYLC